VATISVVSKSFYCLSLISTADKMHVMHDATTKNRVHVLHTAVRVEMKNAQGKLVVLDVPLKFEVCPSGAADAEAKQVQSAFHSSLGPGMDGSLLNVACEDKHFLHCEFDDDGIAWKVIKVDYSMSEKEVMCWYYNIQQALEED